MRLKTLLLISALLYSHTLFAFFCPTNFNQIEMGNTQQQVDELCGKPTAAIEVEKQAADNSPQEWSYFVAQAPLLGAPVPGSIKATLAFDKDGKVINITVNGLSVNTADFCRRTTRIGSTRDAVKQACGTPAYINKAQNTGAPSLPTKRIEYQYSSTPPATLIFENGVLVERK